MIDRRTFLTASALGAATALTSGCNDSGRQAIDYSKHPQKRVIAGKNINVNRNRVT